MKYKLGDIVTIKSAEYLLKSKNWSEEGAFEIGDCEVEICDVDEIEQRYYTYIGNRRVGFSENEIQHTAYSFTARNYKLTKENNEMLREILAYVRKVQDKDYLSNDYAREIAFNVIGDVIAENLESGVIEQVKQQLGI